MEDHLNERNYPSGGPITLEDSIQKTRGDELWDTLRGLIVELRTNVGQFPDSVYLKIKEAEGALMKWEE